MPLPRAERPRAKGALRRSAALHECFTKHWSGAWKTQPKCRSINLIALCCYMVLANWYHSVSNLCIVSGAFGTSSGGCLQVELMIGFSYPDELCIILHSYANLLFLDAYLCTCGPLLCFVFHPNASSFSSFLVPTKSFRAPWIQGRYTGKSNQSVNCVLCK